MGKKSGPSPPSVTQQIDPFSQASANIANSLFAQTDPLRTGLTNQFADMFGIDAAPPSSFTGVPGASGLPPALAGKLGNFDPNNFNVGIEPPGFGDVIGPVNTTTELEGLSDVQGVLNQFLPNGLTATPGEIGQLDQVNPGTLGQIDSVTAGTIGNVDSVGSANTDLIDQLAQSLTINQDIPGLFGGAKAVLEQQFGNARDQVLSDLSAGGSLNQGLIDLAGTRAFAGSQILADLAARQAGADERGLERALGVHLGDLDRSERDINRQLGANQFDITNQITTDTANLDRQLGASRFDILNQFGADTSNLDRQLGVDQLAIDRNFASDQAEIDRLLGLSGAQIDINQRNIDRALNIASGGSANALQGFGVGGNLAASAAATQAALANAQANQNAAGKSGLGEAIGSIGAAAIKKCWIAREVFGSWNPKWLLFRNWLNLKAPRWLHDFYVKHGETIAEYISNKPKTKRMIRYSMEAVI